MVLHGPVRFATAILLSLSLAPGPAALAAGNVQTLPAGDIEPPQITHTPLEEFPAGLPLRIQARVTDDSGVRDVTLFYRSEGGTEYRRVAMRKAPGSNLYSADLPLHAGPRIEYFIQASDTAGNTVLGRVFDPYVLTVLEDSGRDGPRPAGELAGEPATVASPAAPVRPERPAPGAIQAAVAAAADEDADDDGISRWVWVGLGVLALGALAASGGGGGGGGEADPGAPPAGASGTGTVTITAPVP